MITKGKTIRSANDVTIASHKSTVVAKNIHTIEIVPPVKHTATIKNQVTPNYQGLIIEPVFGVNSYSGMSEYLNREASVEISNLALESYILYKSKMSITGAKYIGIQQDLFTIKLNNINFAAFGIAVNNGYKYITVRLEDKIVFRGTIKSINTGRESIVEKSLELKCLMKVTELLSDMVDPITVNSSANIWALLNDVTNIGEGDQLVIGDLPEELKDLTFDQDYTFTGYKKTVIDDIISIANDQLSRANNSFLPWIDYHYDQEGIVNLFGPYTIKEVLNMQPFTGLIDTPQISEDSVSFNSIYKYKLVPGRVVFLDNALFKTLGGDSAFVYGWDPNGLYVITEVRYSLSNYPNVYKCSVKARPLSKYNNFVSSLGG